MMFFFKGMIWRFQPLVFGGVLQEDTQNDAFLKPASTGRKKHSCKHPLYIFCAGPRPYFVAFNWIFPPVSVIIDHKQHHKSSIAMFSRGLPFNLWNYWLLEGKTNNPSYLCVARMVGQRLVDYRNAFEVEARPQRCGDVFFGGGV